MCKHLAVFFVRTLTNDDIMDVPAIVSYDKRFVDARILMTVHFEESPAVYQNRPLRFFIVVALCFFAVGLPIMYYWYLRAKYTELAIVDDEVVFTEGLFRRTRVELNVMGIRSVKIQQPFFSRVLGLACIEIYSAGLQPEIRVSCIKQAWAFDDIIKELQQAILTDQYRAKHERI